MLIFAYKMSVWVFVYVYTVRSTIQYIDYRASLGANVGIVVLKSLIKLYATDATCCSLPFCRCVLLAYW